MAWKDIHKLTTNSDSSVRYCAASALGSAYSLLPDKQQALKDLIKLTSDKDNDVRSRAVHALCINYFTLPEKQQAFKNLIKLTNDQSRYIRAYAYHTLGRISIFKASNAEKEEDYRKELEKAITFFEAAAIESDYERFNPSQFCLPFYRSFYFIIFKKRNSERKIDRYISEAYSAIQGSESKELLLEIVKNLANALKKVNNLEKLNLDEMKEELCFYRKHCDRAVELMIDTEEIAPFATIAMKKGMSILDRNLKELIEEIQKRAKIVCKESRGTDREQIVCEINNEIQNAISDDKGQYVEILEDVISILKIKIPPIPENRFIRSKIEALENKKISPEKYHDLPLIISIMSTMKVISEQEIDEKFRRFDLLYDEIVNTKDKLNCISFDISKIKLNSSSIMSDLKTIKEELEKLTKIEDLKTISIEKLDYNHAEKLNCLNREILKLLDEVKILIDNLPKNEDIFKFNNKLDELKQSKSDMLLQKSSAIVSLIGFAMQILQYKTL